MICSSLHCATDIQLDHRTIRVYGRRRIRAFVRDFLCSLPGVLDCTDACHLALYPAPAYRFITNTTTAGSSARVCNSGSLRAAADSTSMPQPSSAPGSGRRARGQARAITRWIAAYSNALLDATESSRRNPRSTAGPRKHVI